VLSRGDSIPSNESKKRKEKRNLTKIKTFFETVAPKFFQKQFFTVFFFQNISKTVSDIEKMCKIKFVGLSLYNNLFHRNILISPTVFEIHGVKKQKQTKKKRKEHCPPLMLGKYYPDCAVQGRISIPN